MTLHGGLGVLDLHYSQAKWVLRRVERVTFEDALTVRRRSTLDIDLTGALLAEETFPRWGNRILLPVMQVRRSSHYDISIEDPSGGSLPFLPRSSERRLLAEGIADLHSAMQDNSWQGLPEHDQTWSQLADEIRKLLDEPPGTASKIPPSLAAVSELIDEFRKVHIILAAVEERQLVTEGRFNIVRIHEHHAERVLSPSSARLYWSPERSDQEVKRLYEEEPTQHRVAYSGHYFDAPTEWRPVWMRQKKIDDRPISIPAAMIDAAESYHMEVLVPSGLYVSKSTLLSTEFLASGQVGTLEVLDDDSHWDAAHVSFRQSMHSQVGDSSATSRRVDARMIVVLRPMYHGMMRTGQNVAVVGCALLWTLTFTVGWASAGWDAVWSISHPSGNFLDPVTAIVLLAPSAVLGIVIRQEENLLTKSVADAFRRRMGAMAMSTFAAAVAIAVGVFGPLLFWLLLALSILSSSIALVTWGSAWHSERQLKSSPPVPSWMRSRSTPRVRKTTSSGVQ